jgi:hypothetical protein
MVIVPLFPALFAAVWSAWAVAAPPSGVGAAPALSCPVRALGLQELEEKIGSLQQCLAHYVPPTTRVKTPSGTFFEYVDFKKFGMGWKAPDGVVWSQYIGKFSNDAPEGEKSDAQKACELIGGSLPTAAQYRLLNQTFELVDDAHSNPGAREAGKKAFLQVFADSTEDTQVPRVYWAKPDGNVDPISGEQGPAQTFVGPSGDMKASSPRPARAVRCVSKN